MIVIYTADGEFLLLERRRPPGFWQSVTGSMEWGEHADAAARREVIEETGITQGVLVNLQWTQVYEILPAFGKVYAPGVTRNLEHAFSLRLPHRVAGGTKRSRASAISLDSVSARRSKPPPRAPIARSLPNCVCRHQSVRTIVVYVHGLWLSGNEGGILLRRLAETVECEDPRIFLRIDDVEHQRQCTGTGNILEGAARGHSALGRPQPGRFGDIEAVRERGGRGTAAGTNRTPGLAAEWQPRGAKSRASAVRQNNHGPRCTRGIADGASAPLDGAARTGGDRGKLGNRLGKTGGGARRAQRWHDFRGRDAAAGVLEHLVLRVSHTALPLSSTVARQTAAFLRDGSFMR